LKLLLTLLIAIVTTVSSADQLFDTDVDEYAPRYETRQDPRELRIDGMPEYPRNSDLRKLNIRHSNSIFYVDLSSINPGKDNVVRLVSVAVSPSGARTVIYEGFDCGYKRYKKYGFAGAEGPLIAFKTQEWNPLVDQGEGRYRAQLVDNYLCAGFAYAASRKKILSRMSRLDPYKE
jgi:hypothetical protein